jgi:HAD superfamily hydrolase (TIGR01662 family)
VSPQIKAVLFDLGDTLIHSRSPWQRTFEGASLALTQELINSGLKLDRANFSENFLCGLKEYYAQREDTFLEKSTFTLLQDILNKQGYRVALPTVRTALEAFYTITRTKWFPEDDALQTLQTLYTAGFRLAILSNAGDDNDVHVLVNKVGATKLMDFILTSAACGIRKPHRQIFENALSHWDFPSQNVAMVGDRLDADILGANQMGIFSIWINRRTEKKAPGPNDPIPGAIIENLRELPRLLKEPV